MTNIYLKRRDFLRIVGIGSVAGLTAYALDRSDQPVTTRVTETRLLMGTLVNLTLITDDEQAGCATLTASLDHMARLERVMSRHQADSQLSRLNRDGYLDHADTHLVRVLREAVTLSALTEGAFDVTVKPLVDLYEAHFQADHGLPAPDSIAAALQNVGTHYLDVQENHITFTRPQMAITLDGIAKGYIVDEGVSILRQHGFQNVLVEAGGDLAASGVKTHEHSWRIGIQSPRQDGAQLFHTFSITNQAAATSGDYMQAYSDDLKAHHIVDPRTGWSAPELASATVVASNAMLADVFATAMMVMGSTHGPALVEKIPLCEAYLVTKDLNVRHSSGFA